MKQIEHSKLDEIGGGCFIFFIFRSYAGRANYNPPHVPQRNNHRPQPQYRPPSPSTGTANPFR